MADHPHICLPSGIKRSLQIDNTDIKFKRNFQKALEGLRNRPYPHNVYVKKLKGIDSFLLEARLDQKERLLFDYTSRYCAICQEIVPHVRIREYVADHDDVTRTAKRLNREIDDATLTEWDGLPTEEAIPQGNEARFDHYKNIVNGCEETIEDSTQWFQFDEDEFDRLISQKHKDLHLVLTEEQAKYLRRAGPVMINGSAGSGKTTLGVYFLLRAVEMNPELKALYVTYSDSLLKYAKDLYLSLSATPYVAGGFGQSGVWFSTYRQVCFDLVREQVDGRADDKQFETHSEITFSKFSRWLQKYPDCKEVDPARFWIELRSILRGSIPEGDLLDQNREVITEKEYKDIGRKRTVFADKSEVSRPFIYKIGKRYQKYLEDEKFYDELSITRAALRKLQDPVYDVVVVDEVQDLTEIQIELLLRLVRAETRGKDVFLTGDLQQVINPSSFRWEDVRSRFYARGWDKPELLKLTRNFRCQGAIVNLANKILNLRQEKVGKYADESSPESPTVVDGEKPLIFCGSEVSFLRQINEVDIQGIDIVVRTVPIRDRLKKRLNTSSVWVIEETKGLEFKDIILWKLTDGVYEKFDEIEASNDQKGPLSEAAHEFNKLYVAVTRARRTLVIYESHKDRYPWKSILCDNLVEEIQIQDINTHLNVLKTQQDWFERGSYLFGQKKFEQAAEAFARAGDIFKCKESKAHQARDEGHFLDAASLFEEIEMFEEAATYWEHGDNLRRAAVCWEKAGKNSNAAIRWEQEHEYSSAAENWSLAEDHANAANCWEKANEHGHAAVSWEKVKECRNAARCWLKVDNFYNAAHCLQLVPDFQSAAPLWEKAGEISNAAECWMEAKLFDNAACCWEQINRFFNAALCSEKANEPERAATTWEKIREYPRAARIWENVEKFNKAARDWVFARQYLYAAENWCKANQYARAAVCMQLAKEWRAAGEYWYKSKDQIKTNDNKRKNKRLIRAAKCFIQGGDKKRAGNCYREAGDYENALKFNVKLTPEEMAICLTAKGEYCEAAKKLQSDRQFVEAAKNWRLCRKYEKEALCWKFAAQKEQKAEYYYVAEDCYKKLGQQVEAKKCRLEGLICEGKWNEAGSIAESLNDFQKARMCYGKAMNHSAVRRIDRRLKKEKGTKRNPRAGQRR